MIAMIEDKSIKLATVTVSVMLYLVSFLFPLISFFFIGEYSSGFMISIFVSVICGLTFYVGSVMGFIISGVIKPKIRINTYHKI